MRYCIAIVLGMLALGMSATAQNNCCEASFGYVRSGIAEFGQLYRFDNYSTGCFTSAIWEFDGDTVTDSVPLYTIRTTKVLVCLTIGNEADSCYDKVCGYVYSRALPKPCIDSSLITNEPCTGNIAYVCGCDGNQYNNACEAQNYYGLTAWHAQACPVDSSCLANFDYGIAKDSASLYRVHFLGLPTANNRTFHWDFGNGSTTTGQQVSSIFNEGSSYTVCLTISSSSNTCTNRFCRVITLPPNDCNDPSRIDTAPNCGTTLEPVCACNGTTYNNYCLADAAGAMFWREGACTTTGISNPTAEANWLTVYPNPFSGQVNISVASPSNANVTLWVTDLVGKRIATIAHDNPEQQHIWNAEGQPAGYYLLHYQSGSHWGVKKLLLLD